MRVLSLFDGISCARVALEGTPVETYYACEIDKNAIKVSTKNYPDIVQLGDVRNVKGFPVDLLVGGSPCTDLSIAKKNRKGLDGDMSGLFWEFVRLRKECSPRWFLLENVASMPKADKEIITREMGVEPVMINAALVSAQSRKRLFWTNIPFVMPEDRGILLKDILQPDGEVDDRMVSRGKAFCLTASYSKTSKEPKEKETSHSAVKKQRTLVKVGHIGNTDSQANRVYSTEGKSATLSANGGGLGAKTGLYSVMPDDRGILLKDTLQLDGISGRDIGRRLTDAGIRADYNKDIPIQRRIETRTDNKCGTLTSVQKDNLVVSEHRIRKLTPIECERLQGLPDNYTEGIAMTNRYRALGNAFNVEVVRSILKSCA